MFDSFPPPHHSVKLWRVPTDYVNVHSQCTHCCRRTTRDLGGTSLAQFPVNRESLFRRHDSGRPSTEGDDEEDAAAGGASDSTESLLLWRRVDNWRSGDGAAAEKALPSVWWPSMSDVARPASIRLGRGPKRPMGRCCPRAGPNVPLLFLVLLLLLAIALLAAVLALVAHQQALLEERLTDAVGPFERVLSESGEKHLDTANRLMSLLNGTRVRESVRWIASRVHVAGTREQLDLMDRLANEYRSLGFDTRLFDFPEVLLSTPDYAKPNTIHAWDDTRLYWELVSDGLGRPPAEVDSHPQLKEQLGDDARMHLWWNAYSANGSAMGELVYANYGTREDFELLQRHNISVAGKIALIRYGGIFRGDKVHLAQERGAAAAVLYSDPFDYVPGNNSFPDDPWLPPSASQRGTLYRGTGDPETPPPLPSLFYVHRPLSERQLRHKGILPRIPVTSIGYADAQKLFALMGGPEVPWLRWKGSLRVPYRLGGSTLFRVDVNVRNVRRRIRNFVAFLWGSEEPDRWVMVGNHADAWTKGSIDPGTGTSIMLEMARALSNHSAKGGWRPRRTLAFCQWDAEEFGLVGSTEWVEQHLRLLQRRAVAYINVDNLNGNSTLSVKAVPLLYRLIVDSAARVPQTEHSELQSGRLSLLDSWRFHNPRPALPGDRSVPFVQLPHSGSDFQPFIAYAGIPVADLRMESAPQYSYMLYHSAYEVPWVNDRFVDPSGEASAALGRLWLEVARSLADSMIIPFNVEDYGNALQEQLSRADAQIRLTGVVEAVGEKFYARRLEFLEEAIGRFQKVAAHFQRVVQAVNGAERPISVRRREQLNQRLQSLEQCFILDAGGAASQGRGTEFRHVVFAAPEEDTNSGLAFPLLVDTAAKWQSAVRRTRVFEAAEQIEKLRLAFSLVQYCVECAADTLRGDEQRAL